MGRMCGRDFSGGRDILNKDTGGLADCTVIGVCKQLGLVRGECTWSRLWKASYTWLLLWVLVFRSVWTPLSMSSPSNGLCSSSSNIFLKPFAWLVFKHPVAPSQVLLPLGNGLCPPLCFQLGQVPVFCPLQLPDLAFIMARDSAQGACLTRHTWHTEDGQHVSEEWATFLWMRSPTRKLLNGERPVFRRGELKLFDFF